MTSLFATLVAAARGEAAAVEPPPRSRVWDAIASLDIDWRDETPEPSQVPLLPLLPKTSTTRLSGSQATASHKKQPTTSAPDALPPIHTESPAPTRTETIVADHRDLPAAAKPAAPPPVVPVERPLADDHATPVPHEPRGRPDRFEPLLTLRDASQRDPSEAAEPFGEREPGDERSGDSAFLLRIGRIEVRPPTPEAPRAAASPPTRPVLVKRAPVRETLDGYRARQRR